MESQTADCGGCSQVRPREFPGKVPEWLILTDRQCSGTENGRELGGKYIPSGQTTVNKKAPIHYIISINDKVYRAL